ncbi:unnamed protein product [Paramecium pentaurelia]|uniref:Uncharacterized protein n=1 Tax=Paramecium pentaurelia TaxID=43138 RepID=A0A8S1XAE7_9CILI|nr:unnamed protein product [Paramecium pentaurelia]
MQYLLTLCFVLVAVGQQIKGNGKHHKHKNKEIGFVQVSADLNDQRIILEGIIQQVNQLALLVQRQNVFDDSMRQRPFDLMGQLDRLDKLELYPEESKIIQSLKQQLNIISNAMDVDDDIQQCDDEDVCQICQSSMYYQLDDDNWYMIGFEHGFKKEFQFLLDSAKQALGSDGDLLLAFSSENHICLQFVNLKHPIDINGVLKLYLGTTLNDYQNKLIHLPTHGIPLEFLVRAEYQNRNFIYKNLKLIVNDNSQRDILGGRLNKLQFSIFDQNVFIEYDGQFYIQSQIYPFQVKTIQGNTKSEQINIKYSKNIAEQYLSSFILKDTFKFSQMQASTYTNSTDIVISVELD